MERARWLLTDVTKDRSRYWLWVTLIVAASLAAKLVLAFVLYHREVFGQKNVLFDADPNFYLNRFTHDGNQNLAFVHPTVPFLIGVLVRLTAKVGALLTGAGSATVEARRTLAVLVSPLASTVQLVVLAAILKQQLRLGGRAALFLLVINASCFSSLLFGSIPESFALSGCAITILLWLLLDETVIPDRFRIAAWILAGLLTVGITITNAGMVAITFLGWSVLTHRPKGPAVLAAGALAALVTVVSIAGSLGAARLLGTQIQFSRTTRMYGRWVQFHPIASGAHITEAVANTFLPRPPEQIPDTLARPGAPYRMRFTFDSPLRLSNVPWYLPTFLLVVMGVAGYLAVSDTRPQQEPLSRGPGQAAMDRDAALDLRRRRTLLGTLVALIAFNYCVHIFFGFEVFLYSLHWQVPVLLLAAGIAFQPRRWMEATLGIYCLAVAGVSAWRVLDMLGRLR